MKAFFTSEFFKGNRRSLRQRVNAELIVVSANGLLQRNGDSTFPFRQDSNFWYLTGLDEPDLVLVMNGSQEYLIAPQREAVRAAFDGQLDIAALAQQSGIRSIVSEAEGWAKLKQTLKSQPKVATVLPLPALMKQHGFYTNPAHGRLIKRLKALRPGLAVEDIRPSLARMRVIKQAPELEAIERAVDITTTALDSVRKKLNSYKYEYEIEADITRNFLSLGVRHAYEPIVASGTNACTLHYTANNTVLKPKELILFDVGAEVSNYAADISRTYYTTIPTKRQQAVAASVSEALKFGISLLKPGVTFKDTELKIKDFVGGKLQELGLIKKISKNSIRKYYPHWPHFLGLDVHDTGNYEWPLEANMVLTVEPGIYIPEEGIGVRLEDDVLITKGGAKVLSSSLPTSLT